MSRLGAVARVVGPTAAVCLLLVAAFGGAAAPHGGIELAWPDDGTRLFYADDPDPGTAGDTNRTAASGLARLTDLHYTSTRPTVEVENGTLGEYRRQQVRAFDRDPDTSVSLPESPPLESNGVVQDAHVTFQGVVGGADPVVDGRGGPLRIASEGTVLSFADYRIARGNLPDGGCVVENATDLPGVSKRRVCESFSLAHEGGRTLRIGSYRRVAVGDDARAIDYSGVRAAGTVTLRVSFSVTANVTRTVTESRLVNGTWERVRNETELFRQDAVTVSDGVDVRVSDQRRLQVRQRVVQFEGRDRARVVVQVDGPETVADRRLWSRLVLDDAAVRSVWGAYSVTRHDHGFLHDGEAPDPEPVRVPHPLAVRTNVVLESAYVDGTGRVVDARQVQVGDSGVALEPNVNLTSRPESYVTRLVLEDVSSAVRYAEDIHGQRVPVTTADSRTVHRSALVVEELSGDRVRLRLYDPDTDAGIPDRQLDLRGAASDRVRTNASGVAVVTRTDRNLRAEFPGDDWRAIGGFPHDRYYQSASAHRLVVAQDLLGSLFDLGLALVGAVPFVLGLLWLRSMDTVGR